MIKIAVVGTGYVGEHLVETFAAKFQVFGYDINHDRVKELQQKFQGNHNVQITSNIDMLKNTDLFLISVPTLLKEDNRVDASFVSKAVNSIEPFLRPGAGIVIESSVSVGMTRKLLQRFINKSINIGFSPERVDPGRSDPQKNIPKVISGYDDISLDFIYSFYSRVFHHVVTVSSLECAEMVKLYENCFRMINISYVNEISDACLQLGINSNEMIKAAATKPFGFMPFQPGLGVGGHCIPVNPFYLFATSNLPLLQLATKTTVERPVAKAKKYCKIFSSHEKILVVGIGFKPSQRVIDYSPGLLFAKSIKSRLDVVLYDPLVHPNQKELQEFIFLEQNQWLDADFMNEEFDGVFIAMQQHGIDWSVLESLEIPITYGDCF